MSDTRLPFSQFLATQSVERINQIREQLAHQIADVQRKDVSVDYLFQVKEIYLHDLDEFYEDEDGYLAGVIMIKTINERLVRALH